MPETSQLNQPNSGMQLNCYGLSLSKYLITGPHYLRNLSDSILKHRYSTSQNYHYVKEINSILLDERSSSNIKWLDVNFFINDQEYLVENVKIKDYFVHLKNLIDFYKFHNEIPRFFAKDMYELYFEYQDQKRKYNFEVVTKQLQISKGEDPYKELKSQLQIRKNTSYKPFLKPHLMNTTSSYIKQSNQSNNHTVYDLMYKLRSVTTKSSKQLVSKFQKPTLGHENFQKVKKTNPAQEPSYEQSNIDFKREAYFGTLQMPKSNISEDSDLQVNTERLDQIFLSLKNEGIFK